MQQPAELKSNQPLTWSTGIGTDVWALFRSCIEGNLSTTKELLSKDPSLVRSHFEYRKPIYFAVRENQLEVAEYLLAHDPNPLAHDYGDNLLTLALDRGYDKMHHLVSSKLKQLHGCSADGVALGTAIRNGKPSEIRDLLSHSPDRVHARDFRGNQALHWAVLTRNASLINELLDLGADINSMRMDGARPIQLTNGDYHFRAWTQLPKNHPNKPLDILNLLRQRGARLDLCTASHIGDISVVKATLQQSPESANQASDYITYYPCSGTPIRNAAGAGHLEIVQLLLNHGAEPNLPEEGMAPQGHALYSAATNGHYTIAERLLKHGAHPNVMVESSGDTLSRVIANRDQRMLSLLCSYGAAQSIDMLAYYNDIKTAAAILKLNSNLPNLPEALANAASVGHHAFVQLLLRAQPSLPSRLIYPSWAVGAKTPELNKLLFASGYSPNLCNWLEISPLHELARQGDIPKAKLFIEHGAKIHALDEHLRSTPLAWAAKYGQTKMVRFLLEQGGDPNHSDDPNWATPLNWATRGQHPEIIQILREAGANETHP